MILYFDINYDNLYKKSGMDEDEIDFNKINKQIEPFNKELDEIVNMMRDDIGIDVLNHKLTKRIKSS